MTARGDLVGVLRGVRIAGAGAEYLADDGPVDVFIESGRIVDIAPAGAIPLRGTVLDAAGLWAVPGLWDHHVHTVQWALDAQRVPLGEARSARDAAARMSAVRPLADGRRVGAGYRDALWPDRPSLTMLDEATGEVPTYLINADVHSVWLNSAALRREGYAHAVDGVLREEEAFEVSRRLNAVDPSLADLAVRDAGERAAARGVVGLVDFDMAWNAGAWRRRVTAGFDAHRVEFAMYPSDLDRAIDEGLRTGDELEGAKGLAHVGPLKLISDGSLGTRTAACSHAYPEDPTNFGMLTIEPERLVDHLTRAAGAGIEVAVHGIGDRAVASALDAFALTGANGTIEHAQLVRHSDLARFARLGVAASVQPRHALDDRELVAQHWATQTALAYPLASLQRAGAQLRFGSDAPVAALDPWQAIAAAVFRGGVDGAAWHPEEAIDVGAALRASAHHGGGHELSPGSVADIALCGIDPRAATEAELRSMPIAATLVAGRVTYAA